MHAIAYSNAQQRVVTESNAVCVWYDYERLHKAAQGPPKHWADVIAESMPQDEIHDYGYRKS